MDSNAHGDHMLLVVHTEGVSLYIAAVSFPAMVCNCIHEDVYNHFYIASTANSLWIPGSDSIGEGRSCLPFHTQYCTGSYPLHDL